MTEIRYYHLQKSDLESSLPILLTKSLERQWRCLVLVANKERAKHLSETLWTFKADSFLPHGISGGPYDPKQPVLLSDGDENSNNASVLFLTDGRDLTDKSGYDLVCRMFDGRDQEAVARARSCWKQDKDAGHALTYWQQNDRGAWQKKA